jgi:hypothetical protein
VQHILPDGFHAAALFILHMSAARPDDFFIWFPDVDFLPPEGSSALSADDSAGKQVSFGVVTLVHVQYIHPVCHQVAYRFCLLMCDDWQMAVFDEILVSLSVVYPADMWRIKRAAA